ncbi:unnamed protein product [Mortierella alpina]
MLNPQMNTRDDQDAFARRQARSNTRDCDTKSMQEKRRESRLSARVVALSTRALAIFFSPTCAFFLPFLLCVAPSSSDPSFLTRFQDPHMPSALTHKHAHDIYLQTHTFTRTPLLYLPND